jgi:serine/threonine-protein kinase
MPDKDPIHVLVVDDDDTNRDLLSRRLARQGYEVHEAPGGRQALEMVRTLPLDLVLLDVMMPEVDGLQVLTTIRETHSLVDLPVIMVTARDQGGDLAAALNMGANDHVAKPINFTILFARMQTQLALRNTARVHAARPDGTPPKNSDGSGERSYASAELQATQADLPTLGERMVIGDYEVIEELGRGGMGIVYKARHLRMNRVVALKVIDKQRLHGADAVRRFYQEVELAAKLHHPNVVLAFDAGQVGETHYFAMEYVEGVTLDEYVRNTGQLPAAQACDFIRQAALGLQHAHEAGLVHRDIKPANLLVTWTAKGSDAKAPARPTSAAMTARPIVKIMDMGLARLHQPAEDRGSAGELTREGRVVGSVDYMAPEQWMDANRVDIRADLYSLGCTFYYLLSAQLPFPGDDAMEKMLKHHLDHPGPLEKLRPDLSPKVLGAVRRLMAKRREERYQTPAELAMLLNWICQAEFGA